MRNIKRDEIKEKKSWSKTFANQIGEYMELQRYADRFGIISTSKYAFRFILDSSEGRRVVELSIIMEEKVPKNLSYSNRKTCIQRYSGFYKNVLSIVRENCY